MFYLPSNVYVLPGGTRIYYNTFITSESLPKGAGPVEGRVGGTWALPSGWTKVYEAGARLAQQMPCGNPGTALPGGWSGKCG